MSDAARAKVARRLRGQADACRALGSPLTGELLDRAAADVEAGGPVWEVLEPYAESSSTSALSLRFAGAVHRLALEGRAPALAAHYPSTGGRPGPDVGDAFVATVAEHADELRRLTAAGVQTNEVARCAALIVGFTEIGARTGQPLILREVGASAGLNLRWDAYRYSDGRREWGVESPLVISSRTSLAELPLAVPPRVLDRRGCDPAPLDPTNPADLLTLTSYVWPDQEQRLARLRAAAEVAAQVPAEVERAGAAEWLERELHPADGVATVVFHSIMRQYLSDEERQRMERAIEHAGAHASEAAPLFQLSMEPDIRPGGPWPDHAELRLRSWPGGHDELLARAGYHGEWVQRAGGG